LAILVIPARYGSKRLPGKPLLSETGKPLILHVIERARLARTVSRVIVATDDERILDAVRDGGGEAVLTSADHRCGTERVAEVAAGLPDEPHFVNLQGDEPEIKPEDIDTLVETLTGTGAPMATLAAPLDPARVSDPARVKVVVDRRGDALYFSRAPIPFDRDGTRAVVPLLHVGIYGFTREALAKFAGWPATPLERSESLEQLRALENGMRIRVATVFAAPPGVDTMESYREFVRRHAAAGNTESH
jgi:3-deoxy-manno-octulosonate cytidylyltransferase (CMP-KDO synthetase)